VNKAKVEPKTVQGILRHSRIQTTLDLYTQEDSDEARAAQGEFLQQDAGTLTAQPGGREIPNHITDHFGD
jgi:tetrahydromethanopterin S-methyltransferase subunit A